MQTTNTYLYFDGNCREAMTFYGKCLQATPDFTPFAARPDRIMHAEIASGPVVLMAADVEPEVSLNQGNNFSISISCESDSELEQLFAALSEKGKITMALHDAFWGGRFGMITDRFGIRWMLSFRAPNQHS